MSKIWGLHFSRKKTAGGSLPRSTWVLSIQTISSEITAKNAAAEHFGHFSFKKLPKIVENVAGRHVQNLRVAFFLEKKTPEAAYPGAHGFYPPRLSHPKLPRKMRPRNIFGHFLSKNDQKSLKIWPGWHVQNLGVAFFLEKTAGGSLPRSTWVFCPAKSRMACMAWLLGKDQSWQNKHFTKTWFWS